MCRVRSRSSTINSANNNMINKVKMAWHTYHTRCTVPPTTGQPRPNAPASISPGALLPPAASAAAMARHGLPPLLALLRLCCRRRGGG